MELWVRSQDKRELVKTNDIYIVRKDKYFHIYCYANDSEIDLGQYGYFEDKTRALEVLDEIQEKLKIIMTNEAGAEYILARHLVPIIYEMPQE